MKSKKIIEVGKITAVDKKKIGCNTMNTIGVILGILLLTDIVNGSEENGN